MHLQSIHHNLPCEYTINIKLKLHAQFVARSSQDAFCWGGGAVNSMSPLSGDPISEKCVNSMLPSNLMIPLFLFEKSNNLIITKATER